MYISLLHVLRITNALSYKQIQELQHVFEYVHVYENMKRKFAFFKPVVDNDHNVIYICTKYHSKAKITVNLYAIRRENTDQDLRKRCA